MAIINSEYAYNISAIYTNGKEEIPFPNGSISMCVIKRLFIQANDPLFIMKVKIPSTTYNKMQDTKDTAKLVISIGKKVVTENGSGTPLRYIRKQFSYHFPTSKFSDINVNSTDGSASPTSSTDKNAYVECAIGLIDDSIMNANKMIINNIFKNSNNISIIHYYTNNMRMIIEPFDYNDPIDLCIITPMEGITQFIKYMNTISSFYTTDYRFFMDYNYTYLISNKGNPIDVRDGSFTTIQITVDKDTEGRGINIDYDQKIYTIQVKEGQLDYNVNYTSDKLFNKLYGVDSKGEKVIIDLDIARANDSKDRYKMIRIPNDNQHYLTVLKNNIEEGSTMINMLVSNVDNSLFTPYKQYIFSFFRERRDYNGVYILVESSESYVSQGEGEYYSALALKFKRKY